MNFLVVDYSSSYNAIIGKPILNSWKTVTSTYHLSVKFPTEYGVGELQRDQLAARKCYLAVLAMDEQTQTMNIEERRIVAGPAEALEDIPLDEDDPKKSTRIRADSWKTVTSYNAIIGRPILNSWKTVTSTYHLSVKFPTEYG